MTPTVDISRMQTHNARPPESANNWRTPFIVFVAGLLMTSVVVAAQTATAASLSDERFAVEAERIESRLSSEISLRMTQFDVGVDFISSRPRVDADELSAFLERRASVDDGLSGDIGFIVTQSVVDSDLAAFVEAEQVSRPEFEVFNPVPGGDAMRTIITYVERDIAIFGRSFVGFDITAVQDSFTPPNVAPDEAVYALVTPANEYVLVEFGEPFQSPAEFEPAVVYLTAPYKTSDDSAQGFAVKVISVSGLINSIQADIATELAVSARLADSKLPAASVDRRSMTDTTRTATLAVTGTSRAEEVDLDPLVITLTASSSYERTSFARSWLLGFAASLLAAAATIWRRRQTRRLATAAFDVEIATRMAETDSLTGVLNRQGITAALERNGRPSGTLLFIDLDRFKTINDTDGHLRGDAVLRDFARALLDLVRPTDLICRLGGDEFVALIKGGSDPDRVAALTDALQERSAHIDQRLSCSIGVAHLVAGDTRPFDEVVAEADRRMYQHKQRWQRATSDAEPRKIPRDASCTITKRSRSASMMDTC